MSRESIRYKAILDGTSVTDIALADGGYNYYFATRPDGSGVITREKLDETEYRYAFYSKNKNGDIDVYWANKAGHNYIRPNELKRDI